MSVIHVKHMNLKMVLNDEICKLIWIRKALEDIYEISVMFESGEYSGGYQIWFMRPLSTGGFEPICCSMYMGIDTLAIFARQQEEKEKEENALHTS